MKAYWKILVLLVLVAGCQKSKPVTTVPPGWNCGVMRIRVPPDDPRLGGRSFVYLRADENDLGVSVLIEPCDPEPASAFEYAMNEEMRL